MHCSNKDLVTYVIVFGRCLEALPTDIRGGRNDKYIIYFPWDLQEDIKSQFHPSAHYAFYKPIPGHVTATLQVTVRWTPQR